MAELLEALYPPNRASENIMPPVRKGETGGNAQPKAAKQPHQQKELKASLPKIRQALPDLLNDRIISFQATQIVALPTF